MSWFFISCKIQQNIFIFVSLSLIFCSKKNFLSNIFSPYFFKTNEHPCKNHPPSPFVRTTLNSMQNLSSLLLNFFMRNFYTETHARWRISADYIKYVYICSSSTFSLYEITLCKTVFLSKMWGKKKSKLYCYISNFQNSRLFSLKITLFKKSQKF